MTASSAANDSARLCESGSRRVDVGATVHDRGTYVNMDGPAFSTRAESEANRQLGQDNQLIMNEITQLNREKNRHYDLATNTINKMTGMLRSIIN